MSAVPLLDWPAAFAAGTAACGGKGWNLARLARYGFRVPAGGVLTAQAFHTFLDANAVDAGDLDAVRSAIETAPVPDTLVEAVADGLAGMGLAGRRLAVRSSAVAEDGATASFAGIHESTLNVPADRIWVAIRRCWASAYGERAMAYRHRLGLGTGDCAPAVVLMAMAPATAAGIAFSCDPRTGREDRVFVSANFGLGESVVGGHADPDEYVVDVGFHAPEMRVAECRRGRKEVRTQPVAGGGTEDIADAGQAARAALPDPALLSLAHLVVRVRDALGDGETHQDVEWTWDGRELWLVQARPVTTRPAYGYAALAGEPTLWSNGNIRDSLPMQVKPLGWSLLAHPVRTILERFHRATGHTVLPGLNRFKRHRGRGYLNMSVMQWEFVDSLGFPAATTNRLIGGHQRTIAATARPGLGPRARRLLANLRLARALAGARKRAAGHFAGIRAMTERLRQQDRSAADDRELMAELTGLLREFDNYEDLHLVQSASASTFLPLSWLLDRFCRGDGERLARALLIDQAAITSAEQGTRLAELADLAAAEPEAAAYLRQPDRDPAGWAALPAGSPFRAGFERFIDEFGHRAVFELDISNRRWREDPTWLLDTLAAMMDDTATPQRAARRRATAANAWQEIRARVPRPLHGLIRRMARQSAVEAGQREMAKSSVVRVLEVVRVIVCEIARRLAARGILADPGDVYYLTYEDLRDLLHGAWDGRGATALVADRRAQERDWAAAPPPDLLLDDAPHHAAATPIAADGRVVVTGLGVAAGQAEGVSRRILTPHEGNRLSEGEILVAPSTDPGWTPLFLRAAALVTETGGFISHSAIVAREYGIPAVVNVAGILGVLGDGVPVAVDGDHGQVAWAADGE